MSLALSVLKLSPNFIDNNPQQPCKNEEKLYKELGISEEVYSYSQKILDSLQDRFKEIDKITEYMQGNVEFGKRNRRKYKVY